MTVLLQQVSAHGLMCQLVRSAVGTRQSLLQSKTSRCFFYSTVDWLIQLPASLIVREATGTFKLSVLQLYLSANRTLTYSLYKWLGWHFFLEGNLLHFCCVCRLGVSGFYLRQRAKSLRKFPLWQGQATVVLSSKQIDCSLKRFKTP